MRLAAAVSLLALVSGCSAAVGDDVGEDEPGQSLKGAVHVESVVSTDGQLRTHVSARFLRVSGIDGLTGVAPVTPQFGCVEVEAQDVPSISGGSIELLDVGDIVVRVLTGEARGNTMPLAARAFPDVGDLVSGVVYTSRDNDTELPDRATYLIETHGSIQVDGFSVQVDAPDAPAGVHLAETALAADPVVLSAGTALPLRWRVPNPAAGDLVYIDMTSDDLAVRCIFDDDGFGVVPAAYTDFGGEVDVAVHRYRQTSVSLPGVEDAYVDFDFAVSAQVQFQ